MNSKEFNDAKEKKSFSSPQNFDVSSGNYKKIPNKLEEFCTIP